MNRKHPLDTLGDIHALLFRGFYSTAFQPVVETRTARTIGFESLLRGPEDTMLASPGRIFRERDLLPEAVLLNLDRMAVDSAVRTGRNLREGDLIFINVLSETLAGMAGTLDEFLSVLADLRIDPSRIVFELSENTGRNGAKDLRNSVSAIRKSGIRLALDDIGVRSPYLYHLLELEPEFLKLDLVFIKGIDQNRRKQELVRCLVFMAERLGSQLVAEGIETRAEWEAVLMLGVHLSQGYYLGRPQAAEYWRENGNMLA